MSIGHKGNSIGHKGNSIGHKGSSIGHKGNYILQVYVLGLTAMTFHIPYLICGKYFKSSHVKILLEKQMAVEFFKTAASLLLHCK